MKKELKIKLKTLSLEKQQLIKEQKYEEAAVIRQKEINLLKENNLYKESEVDLLLNKLKQHNKDLTNMFNNWKNRMDEKNF